MDRKNISGELKTNPSFTGHWVFIATQSQTENSSILLSIDEVLAAWNNLFHLKSIQNTGVQVNASNCSLSNFTILEILKSQSNYFEFNLMFDESIDDIESIKAANDKVI